MLLRDDSARDMKTFIAILTCSLFVTPFAHAAFAPSVGDKVSYQLTHVQNGAVNGNYVMTNEITAIDQTTKTISVLQTVTLPNGQVMSSGTIPTPASNVAYPDEATIATCGIVSYPGQTGTPETIMVPAGTYKTCHIVLDPSAAGDKGEYYAASVPFGFVKSISTTSTGTMTSELTTFLKK